MRSVRWCGSPAKVSMVLPVDRSAERSHSNGWNVPEIPRFAGGESLGPQSKARSHVTNTNGSPSPGEQGSVKIDSRGTGQVSR